MATGSRGGFSTQILTGNLLAFPQEQPSLRKELLLGIYLAQANRQDAGHSDYRNFDRSHRLEDCRGVVG